MFIFPVQLTTSRIGNLTRLIHTLLYVMTIHTYIHIQEEGHTGFLIQLPSAVREKMSKRLGGIKGCKYKTSSWHINGFPDGSHDGSTV